ncbi:LAFE_0G16204g1_1 [Lachancea fermentati]|uniref:Protein STU1 n=1 Tax=Lachancea fermentati TaxID=4955 RepID=A0A1G4MIX4_LACFM|nr:LAFE_0G16204g1_1 [Lachancea fermentati]
MDGMQNFSLQNVLTDEKCPTDVKIKHLSEFKGHVKKELVHEPSIRSYFEALSFVLRSWPQEDKRVVNLCHSTICYLIKRVAMQAPSQFDAETMLKLIKALLWTLTEDRKLWIGTVKALETMYLAQPSIFESCLDQLCLDKSDRTAVLLFIDELVQLHQKQNRNPMEVLNRFRSLFLGILNDASITNPQPFELIHDILGKYYNKPSLKEFAEHIILPTAKNVFLDDLHMHSRREGSVHKGLDDLFDVEQELREYLTDNSTSQADLTKKDYSSVEYLEKDLEQLVVPFLSIKETEHNWRQRQENVIKLRSILRGNATSSFADQLVVLLKELQVTDCAAKAALSLRTTLSVQGCQLIKDMAHRLEEKLDPIIESLFVPMRNLLSATKKISSQNAFITICVMLSYVQFHNRIFQQCLVLSRDKNVSPRCFAAVFLRIFIVRHHSRLENSSLYIDEWIQRSLSDAQTKVRETMRITFWYYYKMSPSNAKKLLEGLSPQLKRAVELSIPKHLSIDYRPSQVNSLESSRRSSLGPKRTPSYAGPTQSHHAQRNSATRSYSDLAPRSNVQNNGYDHSIRISSDKPFAQDKMIQKPENTNRTVENLASPPSPIGNSPIELTADLTHNNTSTNTLIRKYMTEPSSGELKTKQSDTEQDEMMKYLSSAVLSENIHGLQLLRNLILIGVPLNINIKPILRQIMIKSPISLSELLKMSKFYDFLQPGYLIESLAINHIDFESLLEKFDADELIEAILILFNNLYPKEKGLALYYVKYRPLIFNYCFDVIKELVEKKSNISEFVYDNCTSKLLEVYGNEFDMPKYMQLIFQIYSSHPARFVKVLQESPIFVRLKICKEIKDRDPSFPESTALNRESTVELAADEERKFFEMTMVNPSALQQRSSSTGSVLHNDIKNLRPENSIGNEDKMELDIEEPGFTKYGGLSKLTEMTRVVSLYEKNQNINPIGQSQINDEKVDVDMNREDGREEKSTETDVDLSDIFSQKTHHRDMTVKFDDLPTIIRQSKEETISNESGQEKGEHNEECLNQESTSSDLEKITDSDRESLLPTEQKLDGLDMKLTADPDFEKVGEYVGKKENRFSQTSEDVKFDVFAKATKNSLLEYELLLFEMLNKKENDFGTLHLTIHQIKDGTFTIRDLDFIIGMLVSYGHDRQTLQWMLSEGFHDLMSMNNLLLGSFSGNKNIPPNIVYKTIILTSCLVNIQAEIPSFAFSSSISEQLWEHLTNIITNIIEFNSLYYMCKDLRDLLLRTNLFSINQIEQLLRRSSENGAKAIIRNAFLLESLLFILRVVGNTIEERQISTIISTVKDFASNDITEWRMHATWILAHSYNLLSSRDADQSEFFQDLPESQMALIKSLSTQSLSEHEI